MLKKADLDRIDTDAELAPLLDQYFKIVSGGDDDLTGQSRRVVEKRASRAASVMEQMQMVLDAKLLTDPLFPRLTVDDLGVLMERRTKR